MLKPDSVIVYLRNDEAYPEIEAAVLKLAEPLEIQPRVAAIWEEIAPGIGVAAEAPLGGSFLRYRTLLLLKAFNSYQRAAEAPGAEGFLAYLHDYMLPFGIDTTAPYKQGALLRDTPNFALVWRNMARFSEKWQ